MDMKSSLHSLKQLYGLLQNGSSSSVSVQLDDKSRLLLKELLDSASENVLYNYSKKGKSTVEFTESENDYNSEESDGSFHDCISSGSESAYDSLNKLADVRQWTKEKAQEIACRSLLSKQASDAIKQLDELSDRLSGIVVVQKSVMLARNKPRKTDSKYPYEKSNMGKQHQYYGRDSDQVNRRMYKDPSRSQNVRAFDSSDEVDEFSGNHRKEGLSKKVRKTHPALPRKARRRIQRQHESYASLGSTSSKWRSQKTNVPQRRTISSSESARYSVSGDAIEESSVCSNNDNEDDSWVSGDGPYESTSGNYYSGDDESEGYSKPQFQHRRQARDTKKMRLGKVKKNGRWRKFKDKVSAIIPHHHHHRHNQKYSDGNGEDLSSSENMKVCRKKVPSKNIAIERRAVQIIEHARDNRVLQKPFNALWGLVKKLKSHKKKGRLGFWKRKSRKLGFGFRKRISRKLRLGFRKKKSKKLRLGFRKRKSKKLGLGFRKR